MTMVSLRREVAGGVGSAGNAENVAREEDVEASVGDSVVGTVVGGEASEVVTGVTVVVSGCLE